MIKWWCSLVSFHLFAALMLYQPLSSRWRFSIFVAALFRIIQWMMTMIKFHKWEWNLGTLRRNHFSALRLSSKISSWLLGVSSSKNCLMKFCSSSLLSSPCRSQRCFCIIPLIREGESKRREWINCNHVQVAPELESSFLKWDFTRRARTRAMQSFSWMRIDGFYTTLQPNEKNSDSFRQFLKTTRFTSSTLILLLSSALLGLISSLLKFSFRFTFPISTGFGCRLNWFSRKMFSLTPHKSSREWKIKSCGMRWSSAVISLASVSLRRQKTLLLEMSS